MTLLFVITWVVLLVYAVRLMARGYTSNYIDPGEVDRPSGTWTTQVKRPVHPEMVDVKPGEELMGVTFDQKPSSCDLDEYKDLQARIEVLRSELEDPWDDDDDDEDDDGGDIVALNR